MNHTLVLVKTRVYMRRNLSNGAFTTLIYGLSLLSGCCWSDSQGTHHLIVGIGFGIITTTNRCGVEARESRILGGEIGPDGAGIGWFRHHRVQIDPNLASNVVVSIKANSLGCTIDTLDPYDSGTNIQYNYMKERKANE